MARDPLCLLLIEDNPADLRLMAELFEEAAPGRFRIRSAQRLADALLELSARSYPVVLLDLSLPDASGLETIDAVRRVAPTTPLIVLSGLMDPELAERARERGASASFAKGDETITDIIDAISRFTSKSD